MKTSKTLRILGGVVLVMALFSICFLCSRLPSPEPSQLPTLAPTMTSIPPTPTLTPLPAVNLSEAIEKGDVEAEIHGSWAILGVSMTLKVTNRTGEPLEIVVPAGTVLLSSKKGYQDMLVTVETRVALLDDAPQEVGLVAYCIDAELHAPTDEISYSIGDLDDPALRQLVEKLPEIKKEAFFGELPLLGAIWSLTDDISISEIQKRLMYGYPAQDMVQAKLILEAAGIDTSSRLLFSPQNPPENATWHYGMGEYFYWVEEDMQAAVAEFSTAIESEPRASIYQMRSFAYEKLEMYDQVLADLDRALALEPSPVFHRSKAEVLVKLGEFEHAIIEYQKAIELTEDSYDLCNLYKKRAEMCMEQGFYKQAVDDYTEMIECRHDRALVYYNRAEAYLMLGNYESAIADYTKAIELNPDWDLNYWGRANAYKEAGQIEEAIADFQQVIDMGGNWASSAERELEWLKTDFP